MRDLKRLIDFLSNQLSTVPGLSSVILSRLWQFLGAPVSLWLLTKNLPIEAQGYYFTFSSLIALQAFSELGMCTIILHAASHFWAKLTLGKDGRIEGDLDSLNRLSGLFRFSMRWFLGASVLFALSVGIGGWNFFSTNETKEVAWKGPWVVLVVVVSLSIFISPAISILEGCGQILVLSKYRLVQSIISSFATWACLWSGTQLWALVASASVILFINSYVIVGRYRAFIGSISNPSVDVGFNWRKEIWPLQWRLAVQALFGYFMSQISNPLLFRYYGAAAAGRMGISLQIMNMIQSLAGAWLQLSVPKFGELAAKHELIKLDELFKRTLTSSLWFLVVMCALATISIFALQSGGYLIGDRFLPAVLLCFMSVNIIATHIIGSVAAYVRAYRVEPFLLSGIVTGILNAIIVWWAAVNWAATGIVVSTALFSVFISVPWIVLIANQVRNRTKAGSA